MNNRQREVVIEVGEVMIMHDRRASETVERTKRGCDVSSDIDKDGYVARKLLSTLKREVW